MFVMKINIKKRYGILIFLVLIITVVIVLSSPSPPPNPGHPASEIGSGTFSGDVNDIWSFPGKVGIGVTSPTKRLDVDGYVKGRSGLCIGDDCRSSWPGGGGGDITAVYAGNGLTGGGTSGDVTLHVGAGTGISVGSNSVGLKYPSKSCPSGKAIRSFNLGSSSGPVCVDVGGDGLSGSGTTNYIPKWTGSKSLGNSVIYQTGSDIKISGRLGTAGRSPSCPNGWSCGVHTYDIYADGAIHANKWIETNDKICIRGDCRTSWPEGISGINIRIVHASSWSECSGVSRVECPAGYKVVGGGFDGKEGGCSGKLDWAYSYPDTDHSWKAAQNDARTKAYAICIKTY